MQPSQLKLSALEKALFVLAALFYAVFIVRGSFRIDGELYFSLFDDAMISMRYAQNLAEGHGLLWNPGEPPVEGYTNFLWTLWMALLHRLPVPESKLSLLVMLSSVACLFANALVVRRIASLVSSGNRIAILGSFTLTLFSYPLVFWSLRGMEVGLLVLLIDVAILCSVLLRTEFRWRTLGTMAAALSLGLLTRPDMGLSVGLLVAFAVLGAPGPARVKVGLVLLGAAVVTIGGHLTFRELYYHDAVPNTYYLKVSGTPLSARVGLGITTFLRTCVFEIWPLLVVPLVVALRNRAALLDPSRLLLLSLLGGQCAYSIYVGGDAWEQLRVANRYISIVLPAGIVLTCTLLGEALAAKDAFLLRALAIGSALSLSTVVFFHSVVPDTPLFIWGKWFLVYSFKEAVILAASLYGLWVAAKRPAWPIPARGVAVPLLVCLNLGAFTWWVRYGFDPIDQEMTRLGVAIARATRPTARIGVVWAGAPPYFSHRPSVDLLGKSDSVIAHLPSHLPFLPGHTKWDYRYSIPTYKPDLILQTWRLNASDRAFLAASGYTRLENGVYVRNDSREIDLEKIASLPYKMRHNLEEL